MLTQLFQGRTERLFERFRRTGNSAALAEVFDRTAPELFGLAARLAPAPGLAQDLLQQTFLAAIESAESWDSTRRLAPWLVGILVREARLLRRREARVPQQDRIGGNTPPDPARTAEEREFAAALARALETLPERYRQVLELHLVGEKPAAEIANELGRTSGTVRVQIHRGLEMLRRLLPAGFAAAGAVAVVSPRALADVRARVLGAVPGGGGAALMLGAGTAIGGLVLKKLGLAAAVLVVAGGALWLALDASPREDVVAARDGDVEQRTVPATEGADADVPERAPEQSRATRSALEGPADPARDASEASLSGRLLDADGVGVAGVSVALLELSPDFLQADWAAAFDGARAEPRLVVATTRTDAEGHFRLEGAQGRALHALGIDLGGRRGTLRLLDEGLVLGATTDIGDVVLAAAAPLAGRVVDREDQPLAGVRVRVVESYASEELENDLHRLRATSLVVGVSRRWRELPADASERAMLVALSHGLMNLCESLPVPTAHTDADGRFTLDAPLGQRLVLVADDSRFAPVVREGLAVAGPMDVGAIVLDPGRTLACRVVDAAGAPLSGVEVRAGTLAASEEVAVCGPAVEKDGVYTCPGGTGDVELFAVRADAASTWTVAGPFEGGGTKTVVLESACTLLLDVHDGSGNPVEGLEAVLTSVDELSRQDETEFLALASARCGALERIGPTRYAMPGVAPGIHYLSARAPGRAVLRNQVVVAAPEVPAELVLVPSEETEVRVVDAVSKAPVSGASIAVRTGERGRHAVVARAVADGTGRATVQWGEDGIHGDDPFHVRVEHQGFAAAVAPLAPGTKTVEIALARPARLLAHVHRGGASPGARHLLALQPQDDALRCPGNLPWHAVTDEEGRCSIGELSPGVYRYELGERFLDSDAFALLLSGRLGKYFDFDKGILERRLARGTVELRAGEELRLEIDLGAQPPAGSTTLSGRLVRGGRGMAGIELELCFVAEPVWDGDRRSTFVRTTDASGAFDFGVVKAGTARLAAEDHELGSTILRLEFPLAAGERRVLDLPFDPLTVDVVLVDSEGQPLPDAELELTAHSRLYEHAHVRTRTDGAGRARVTLPGCGLFGWEADAGSRHAEGTVYVLPDVEPRLVFEPPVTVPIQLTLPPELECSEKNLLLSMRPGVEGAEIRVLGPLDPATWSLEFEGPPGRYQLTVGCGDRRCRPIELDVPPAGVPELRLTLELAE